MNTPERCQVCGGGHVSLREEVVTSEYKGHQADLSFQMLECSDCGSEFAGAAESRFNKRAVIAFHKRVDGLLSGQEIRALREQLGLSQVQAATLFGGGRVAFSKYENDDVSQAESMDKLLRVVRDNVSAFVTLVRQSPLASSLLRPEMTQNRQVWKQETNVATVVMATAEFAMSSDFRPSSKTRTADYPETPSLIGELVCH